jgi:hypothetical protein
MFGDTEIYTALNVTAITDLIDDYNLGPALFDDQVIPQDFEGTASINFYMNAMYNGGLEADQITYTVNCRDIDSTKSRIIAKAVFDTLNRVFYANCFMICGVLGTIPPVDDTDNYNTPVEITIKQR